ncbi:hypothetical protein Bca52824_056911 [Brassica carinata]|uniref:Bet v I/Major latex protein domain-containing protein n=1 Tax=Brassica carinata TaxID=52824 RepID=A0A8X7UFR6_BRACI|nr:hypothetical protein Bca52824_056911 [Brassica carinata]
MARILETTVELKSSPGKFLDMFVGKQQFEVSSICPSYIQGCELREGEMGQVGSIVVWRYVHGESTLQFSTYINTLRRFSIKISFIFSDLIQMRDF